MNTKLKNNFYVSFSLMAIFVLSFFIFSSCQTVKSLSFNDMSPFAIISVTGTNLVSWQNTEQNDNDEQIDTDGAFNSLVNRVIDSKNPEILTAVDRLDYAEESFRLIANELTNAKVIAKEAVVNSDIYKYSYRSLFNSLSDSTCATGYKDMTVIGAKKARLLIQGLEAKSLVAMDFNFKKILASGNKRNGQVAAAITMKMKILDEKGRVAVNKDYYRQSSQTVLIQGGYYDKDALIEIINTTIDELITAFVVEYM